MLTLVLAGNRAEYDEWCRSQGIKPYSKRLPREAVYGGSQGSIEGLRADRVVELAGFAHRHDERVLRTAAAYMLAKSRAAGIVEAARRRIG